MKNSSGRYCTTVLVVLLAGVFGSVLAQNDPVVSATHITTHMDRVPRFCQQPSISAVNSGDWGDPNTWSPSRVPSDADRVLIGNLVTVTYDTIADTPIDCIEIGQGSTLQWRVDRNTRLVVSNLQVMPGGQIQIGSVQSPMGAGLLAEVVIPDRPLDTNGIDPAQYGNGVHVFGGLSLHGSPLTPTFVRFANEPSADEDTLALSQVPVGWQPSDRLLIPDTRHIPFRKDQTYVSQAELVTLQTLNGAAAQLTQALNHDHHGPRDGAGNVGPVEMSMLPHVGNLSRNIVFRSARLNETVKQRYCRGEENLSDTDQCITLGHFMVHARAAVDVRYVAFENLGRTLVDDLDNAEIDESGAVVRVGTNQVGRYSFHMHHVRGPDNPNNEGYQFHFVGNVIEGFLKWGLTIHNTHFGLVADNILYDGEGSAIATEDGNEAFNVFERNFVVHTGAGDTEQILESPGRAGVENQRARFGFTRDGFWFSGMYNYVRDNVVTNAPGFAYNYNGYYLSQQQPIPDFRGADMSADASILIAPAVLESARNEAYGATGQGLWLTWSRGCCRVDTYTDVSLFEDYRIWHVNHSGVETYHEARNTFDRFVLRNSAEVSAQSGGGSSRFNRAFHLANSSYENGQVVISNLDAQGFNIGIRMPLRTEDGTAEPNRFTLRDSVLRNHVNVQEFLPNIDRKTSTISNVSFLPLDLGPVPGLPEQPTSIQMNYNLSRDSRLADRHSATLVFAFDGVEGDDLELYFEQQAPDYPIPPPSGFSPHPNFVGCPEANLTNQQCWNRYQVAIAGRVAPCEALDGDSSCDTARARAAEYGIIGLAFPLTTLFADSFEE